MWYMEANVHIACNSPRVKDYPLERELRVDAALVQNSLRSRKIYLSD